MKGGLKDVKERDPTRTGQAIRTINSSLLYNKSDR